jgi:hypothetical protein
MRSNINGKKLFSIEILQRMRACVVTKINNSDDREKRESVRDVNQSHRKQAFEGLYALTHY